MYVSQATILRNSEERTLCGDGGKAKNGPCVVTGGSMSSCETRSRVERMIPLTSGLRSDESEER
eukprot:3630764-Prorocentrum_lima.AAC.1